MDLKTRRHRHHQPLRESRRISAVAGVASMIRHQLAAYPTSLGPARTSKHPRHLGRRDRTISLPDCSGKGHPHSSRIAHDRMMSPLRAWDAETSPRDAQPNTTMSCPGQPAQVEMRIRPANTAVLDTRRSRLFIVSLDRLVRRRRPLGVRFLCLLTMPQGQFLRLHALRKNKP